ncbi:MAG: D-alanine--D-alanine ligase [Solirubrobacterales bacterium]
MRVAVLKGGRSLERVVSLQSGARVEDAAGALGHEVVPIDADEQLVARLREARPDVAFIALHGPGGEDGTVQSLLELLGIPYTGPGIGASVLCMDKVQSKHRMRAAGIPTPDWVAFGAAAFRELGAADAFGEIEAGLGLPLVVKPAAQGSALGVRFAGTAADVPAALVAALSYDDRVLLERHIEGRELAVSVLDGEALPIVEAIPEQADAFNYEARYEIGRTRYACPAELGEDAAAAVREVALRTWEVLGCEGFARVDVMLGGDGVGPQVLEVNSVPGLTDTSLLPMAAEAAGISFERFVERALELALRA